MLLQVEYLPDRVSELLGDFVIFQAFSRRQTHVCPHLHERLEHCLRGLVACLVSGSGSWAALGTSIDLGARNFSRCSDLDCRLRPVGQDLSILEVSGASGNVLVSTSATEA